ncbi:sodium:solute symporter family transporter [Chitinophaga sedimenti]|uniref:sodium:solute symporter family transporter n=1 Tax=Chitinophaga sedimenti TaxID=2033606 RepID=UPI0027E0F628|nr:sodium:solute symporter [Chitinophaga sedimenti]
MLFLIQRGLSTGISICAPSIILSSLLGWNIYWTNLFMGGLLIIYTMFGGTKAVSYTQTLQLAIIFGGMFLAGAMVIHLLPAGIAFTDALKVSGKMGKLNVIVTEFNFKDRYNIWSGLIGGFFLALSYFGTDQSQVGRYLTARTESESKLGLLMNGLVKVPMQFLILLIGALVFVFYLYFKAPVFFNEAQLAKVRKTEQGPAIQQLEQQYAVLGDVKTKQVRVLSEALKTGEETAITTAQQALQQTETQAEKVRKQTLELVKEADPAADTNDTNYVFLHFVVNSLPKGLVGLLIAIIFLASWGSIAAALNSLASTTVIDVYQRMINPNGTEAQYLKVSRMWTLIWGVFSILVAQFATGLGSLIEAVNILGSLFYGTILGIFLVAFWLKHVKGDATFFAALMAEVIVIAVYRWDVVSFLWLNVIGCLLVIILAFIFQLFQHKKQLPEGVAVFWIFRGFPTMGGTSTNKVQVLVKLLCFRSMHQVIEPATDIAGSLAAFAGGFNKKIHAGTRSHALPFGLESRILIFAPNELVIAI